MKKTFDGYCARCESTVTLTLDSGADGPAPSAEFMDRCPSCGGAIHPAEHFDVSGRSWMEAVNDQVQHDRIEAMRRGEDPVR